MSNGAKAADLRRTETKRGSRTDASQDAASMHAPTEPVVPHLRVELGHGRLDIFAFTINVTDTLPQVLRQHDDPKSKPGIPHYSELRIDAVCSVGDSQRLLILLPRRAHQSW